MYINRMIRAGGGGGGPYLGREGRGAVRLVVLSRAIREINLHIAGLTVRP